MQYLVGKSGLTRRLGWSISAHEDKWSSVVAHEMLIQKIISWTSIEDSFALCGALT